MKELVEQFREYVRDNASRGVYPFCECKNHYEFTVLSGKRRDGDILGLSRDNINTLKQEYGFKLSCQEDHRVCFGKYLNYIRNVSDPYHTLFIWLPYVKPKLQKQGNFTWMTKEQLEEHVNYPKYVLGLDYECKVYEPKRENYDYGSYYEIFFDFKTLDYFQQKFILFWARYSSEFPQNLAILDAMILRSIYPEEELYNLLIMSSFLLNESGKDMWIAEGQCMSIYGRFIKKYILKKRLYRPEDFKYQILNVFGRLKKDRKTYVCGNYINTDYGDMIDSFNIRPFTMKIEGTNILDLSVWINSDNLKTRLETYERLYPWYKKEEIVE